MGWLDKLLGRSATGSGTPQDPATEAIHFGRYSDNNKSRYQMDRWHAAEALFKEKKYGESIAAFFDYLADKQENNVQFSTDGVRFSFELIQGSKKIYGSGDGQYITAHVPLVKMSNPGAAVMRRMLELNYGLLYSRTALDDDHVLSMLFDSTVDSANPNKLYYGLKELATKADRQDNLLLNDFKTLEAIDTRNIERLPAAELEVKYRYFRHWIGETLDQAAKLNADTFSGGIAYLLLNLLYRIDYLIAPEASLLAELEKINGLYWTPKEETPVIERNHQIQEAFRKLLELSPEAFAGSVYRARATFAITNVPKAEKVKEVIENSNRDSYLYIENKHPELALVLNEYGMSYNQYTFSMPRVVTDFYHLYMMVRHAGYFAELGWTRPLYHQGSRQLDKAAIQQQILQLISRHKEKFPNLRMDMARLRFDDLYQFGLSFSDQIAGFNLDLNRPA